MSEHRAKKVKALLAKFRSVALERLERLNNSFLKLESQPADQQASSMILREIHTLKGEAKLMGFQKVNIVAHKTEDLIFHAKEQNFHFSERLGQSVLTGLDLIQSLMISESGATDEQALDAFLERADRILTGEEEDEDEEPPDESGESSVAYSSLHPRAYQPTAPPEVEVAKSIPLEAPVSSPPEVPLTGSSPMIEVERTKADLKGSRSMTIRVDVEKLDFLADRVADIARYHAQLEAGMGQMQITAQQWRRENLNFERELRELVDGAPPELLKRITGFITDLRSLNDELFDVLSQGQEIIFAREYGLRELENSVKGLRLVPLSTLFGRYPRALRDLAKEQGKQVRVIVVGKELEVDNRVLEYLDEPLLHLFRNAVDHGIESPEERRKAGKPVEGLVRLSARQGGSHVEIDISDDGRGLSPEAIINAAVRRGLITRPEASTLSASEVIRLVLTPGFSTREQTTDVSGRGMGMDVVRERVESLGGSVGITGEPGKGSTIRLWVPISVALMPALVVRIGEVFLAFPSHSVASIFDVEEGQLRVVGTECTFRYEDEHIPVESLSALLGVGESEVDDTSTGTIEGYTRVLVVEDQGRRLGLIGGRIIEERELTLKPLDAFLRGIHLFIGTAILDQGEPALVVSVSELIRRVELGLHSEVRRSKSAASERRLVLLAEDSEIVRDVLEEVLRGLGYVVLEAANGRDALAHLEAQVPDLVVTDLEMPVMDGFELIKQIRAMPRVADIPIVVLSSRGSSEDKQRAGELGADAYIVKSEFNETILAETINRFLSSGETRR